MLEYRFETMSARDREAILSRGDTALDDTLADVKKIIESVRTGGDSSLKAYAREFDGYTGGTLAVPTKDIRDSAKKVPSGIINALSISRTRIEKFHSRQSLKPFKYSDDAGIFGQMVVPLNRVGVYVPGGTASYMSSVLMACIPARLAGVKSIAICTPGKQGRVPAEILAAAEMCRVREIYPIGGAHAIAALAYGTESIRQVQKIVGPGGAFVSAAKLLVRNDCEIDFLAGPSEVLIIADSRASPELIARDMLAQLEHDPLARAVLVTSSSRTARETEASLVGLISTARRKSIASKAAERGAIFIVTRNMKDALVFANEYAPEHLLIDTEKPETVLSEVRNAGSVFLGSNSSVVFGDYCSGTNHILPTMGVAAVKSSLSVYDFLKIIPYQNLSFKGAAKLSKVVDILARAEGLPAHADAAIARRTKKVK